MGRVREEKRREEERRSKREEKRREEERRSKRESLRRKKIQVHEKVGKSQNTVFFQLFVAPEGRKVGSLKRRVRSHLARWEMKNCTPLWREAHLQVKKLKTLHVRTTFGSCDVEKGHWILGLLHSSQQSHSCSLWALIYWDLFLPSLYGSASGLKALFRWYQHPPPLGWLWARSRAAGRSLSSGQESCAHLCRASGESVCLASSQPFLKNVPALNTGCCNGSATVAMCLIFSFCTAATSNANTNSTLLCCHGLIVF